MGNQCCSCVDSKADEGEQKDTANPPKRIALVFNNRSKRGRTRNRAERGS